MSVHEPYSEPPPALANPRPRHLAGFLGPGIIIASVTIGSGELLLASRSGAVFGHTMFWCFLIAGFFKGLQVYTAARHLTLTGEHPLESWKKIPYLPHVFPLVIAIPTVMVMPIAFSGISEALGGYLHQLLDAPVDNASGGTWDTVEWRENIWATVTLVTCVTLACFSSGKILEWVSTVVIFVLLVCICISVAISTPDLWSSIKGLFYPIVNDYPHWVKSQYPDSFQGRSPWLEVALYLTAVGGGTYDYVGYIGMLRERAWGRCNQGAISRDDLEAVFSTDSDRSRQQLQYATCWLRAPLMDISISFTLVIIVTLLFALLGAELLHPRQLVPAGHDLLFQQERFLGQLSQSLIWVYRVGVLLAFMGTLYGAFEVYYYTISELSRALLGRWHVLCSGMIRPLTISYCFLGGLTMMWLPKSLAGDVVSRMTFGAVFGGALSCGLWCFAMIWSDYSELPKSLRMHPVLLVLLFVAGLVMTGLGVQTLIAYFG